MLGLGNVGCRHGKWKQSLFAHQMFQPPPLPAAQSVWGRSVRGKHTHTLPKWE